MNTLFASIPSPTISYVDLGPVRVHFYALFILVGIAVAIWVANSRLVKRGAPSGQRLTSHYGPCLLASSAVEFFTS